MHAGFWHFSREVLTSKNATRREYCNTAAKSPNNPSRTTHTIKSTTAFAITASLCTGTKICQHQQRNLNLKIIMEPF